MRSRAGGPPDVAARSPPLPRRTQPSPPPPPAPRPCAALHARAARRAETEVPDRLLPALGALRDIVAGRPAARAPALRLALELATDGHEARRAAAIRLVASRLNVLPEVADEIEAYAVRIAEELMAPGAAEGAAEGEGGAAPPGVALAEFAEHAAPAGAEPAPAAAEAAAGDKAAGAGADASGLEGEARRRLLLLLALCTKKPQLLSHVLRVGAGASAGCQAAQAVLQQQLGRVLSHLPPDARMAQLERSLHDHPPGAASSHPQALRARGARRPGLSPPSHAAPAPPGLSPPSPSPARPPGHAARARPSASADRAPLPSGAPPTPAQAASCCCCACCTWPLTRTTAARSRCARSR